MKKTLLTLLFAVAIVSCNRSSSGTALTWGNDTLLRFGEWDVVGLVYPVAQGGAAADSINRVIVSSLRDFFTGEDLTSYSLPDAIDTLLARKNRDSVTNHLGYMMQSEGETYTRGALTSVLLMANNYTGGAHGIPFGRIFNFDNRTGRQLAREELFKDTVRLAELNRAVFKRDIASGYTGEELTYLFVDLDSIPLPANIGFDTVGVRMLYNPYEIAAYAFGPVLYSIPYDEAESVLQRIAKNK